MQEPGPQRASVGSTMLGVKPRFRSHSCREAATCAVANLARLPADHGGLAEGADLGDAGGDDLPHDPVSPPVATARVAGRRVRGDGGLRLVAVVDRQLHAQGPHPGHAGLLASVPRPDPSDVADRRDRGTGPQGHDLRRRHRNHRPGGADHLGAEPHQGWPRSGATVRSMSIARTSTRTGRRWSRLRPWSPTTSASGD